MTKISSRHLPPLLAMLLLPLALVLRNTYGGLEVDTCADPAGLLEPWELSSTYDARERWDLHRTSWIQWTEGKAYGPREDIQFLDFRIIRSFEPRRIYVRPGSFVPGRLEPHREEPLHLRVRGEDVPVFVGRFYDYSRQGEWVVAWMYVYEGRPVRSPFAAQLASALPQILEGTRPLTLYLVSGFAPPNVRALVEWRLLDWLRTAWKHHADTCG